MQVILTLSWPEKWMLDIATYFMQKILNFSYVWRLEFFVKKWNMYEAHIIQRPLQQTCRLETTTLCLNTRLRVNKNFKIQINFIKINVNACLFVLTTEWQVLSFILEDRTVNKKSVTHLVFMFQLTFIFRILRSRKAYFSHHSISPKELCTNEIKVVGGQ